MRCADTLSTTWDLGRDPVQAAAPALLGAEHIEEDTPTTAAAFVPAFHRLRRWGLPSVRLLKNSLHSAVAI
jgi:hypothetical protein